MWARYVPTHSWSDTHDRVGSAHLFCSAFALVTKKHCKALHKVFVKASKQVGIRTTGSAGGEAVRTVTSGKRKVAKIIEPGMEFGADWEWAENSILGKGVKAIVDEPAVPKPKAMKKSKFAGLIAGVNTSTPTPTAPMLASSTTDATPTTVTGATVDTDDVDPATAVRSLILTQIKDELPEGVERAPPSNAETKKCRVLLAATESLHAARGLVTELRTINGLSSCTPTKAQLFLKRLEQRLTPQSLSKLIASCPQTFTAADVTIDTTSSMINAMEKDSDSDASLQMTVMVKILEHMLSLVKAYQPCSSATVLWTAMQLLDDSVPKVVYEWPGALLGMVLYRFCTEDFENGQYQTLASRLNPNNMDICGELIDVGVLHHDAMVREQMFWSNPVICKTLPKSKTAILDDVESRVGVSSAIDVLHSTVVYANTAYPTELRAMQALIDTDEATPATATILQTAIDEYETSTLIQPKPSSAIGKLLLARGAELLVKALSDKGTKGKLQDVFDRGSILLNDTPEGMNETDIVSIIAAWTTHMCLWHQLRSDASPELILEMQGEEHTLDIAMTQASLNIGYSLWLLFWADLDRNLHFTRALDGPLPIDDTVDADPDTACAAPAAPAAFTRLSCVIALQDAGELGIASFLSKNGMRADHVDAWNTVVARRRHLVQLLQVTVCNLPRYYSSLDNVTPLQHLMVIPATLLMESHP